MTDLTRREILKHPVYTRVLRQAAFGDLPTELELDALKLPPALRRRVASEALKIAEFRAGGEHAVAQREAKEQAAGLVGELPPELQRSDYLREPDPETDDPAALAAQVRRW